jgi:hypothetical protein
MIALYIILGLFALELLAVGGVAIHLWLESR